MSDQFDVSMLPGLPPPGSILVIRGADFGDDEKVFKVIQNHYAAAAKASGDYFGKPPSEVLPLILLLPPEGEAVVWSDDAVARMAEIGWVPR